MNYVCSCCAKEFTNMEECREHEDGCNIGVREVRLSLYDFSITSTIRLKQDVINYTDGNIITMRDTILTKTAEKKLKLRVIEEGKRRIRNEKSKIKFELLKCNRALDRLTALVKDIKENKGNNE